MPKRICVVDDEEDIREIVKTVLLMKDYEVFTAANGTLGMELIQQSEPDLAILDLMMPGMSGLEMCKQLRASEKFKELPIIVLSAVGRSSGKPEEFWRAGLNSDEFMHKPFEPMDLLGRVEYLLRRKDYHATPAGRAANGEVGDAAPKADWEEPHSGVEVKGLEPEEVVQTFIEAWNSQTFGDEFDCLGEEMHGGLRRDAYIQRRRTTREAVGKRLTQKLDSIDDVQIRANAAKIVCQRSNQKGQYVETKRETYTLRQAPSGWKIISVRSEKI